MTAKLGHIATLVLILAACGSPDEATSGDESSGSSGGTGPDSATATNGMSSTSASTTATSSTTTANPTTTSADSGSESMGFINPETGVDTGPQPPGPNGSMCGGNEECESGFCYQVPMLGGLCGECLMDSDCEMGTCALDFNIMYAVCTDGSIGMMCDSDEGCAGELVCTQLIDTGGIFNASFCSDCGPSAPCMGDQVCNPVYSDMGLGGYLTCVDPGSVENDQGCPIVDGMGDGSVCMSGHCGIANLFMFLEVGVCGECDIDNDCPMMGTCNPPTADMGGLMGATCQ
jgi:hypothetical protein